MTTIYLRPVDMVVTYGVRCAHPTSRYLAMLVRAREYTTNTIALRSMYRIGDEVLSATAKGIARSTRPAFLMRYQVRCERHVVLAYREGACFRSRINWNGMRRGMRAIRARRVAALLLCARRIGIGLHEPALGREFLLMLR